MAEKSLMWTTGATGDGATAYTQAEVIRWLRQTFLGDDTAEGVNKGYENGLEVTGVATPVQVDTGAAYVFGFPYWNTVAVDVAVATPAVSTRIDRLVLRAGWAAQTVRIALLGGAEGAGVPPAPTQNDGVTWEITLALVSITTGGTITVTDAREFVHPNIEVTGSMIGSLEVITSNLANGAVTTAKIAAANVTETELAGSVAGDGLGGGAGSALSVNVDDSTIETSGDALQIKALGVDTAELAADSVDGDKAGDRVAQIHRRQGGSATSWQTVGITTYTPGAVRIQCGSESKTDIGASSGTETITFPVAFSFPPIVLVTQTTDDDLACGALAITTTQFVFAWQRIAGTKDSITFNWLAIGPE